MTVHAVPTRPRTRLAAPPAGRSGFTLLEVLVALGILVAGLASVAAILPASGSILAEANLADRSGTLAANAHADLRNRQMLTADQFQAAGVRMVVLGDVFPDAPFAAAPFARHARSGQVTFTLGDDIDLAAGNAPIVRSGGVCYGATIVPSAPPTPVGQPPVGPGSPALVSVAVFKKTGGEMKPLTLQAAGSGVFLVSGPGGTPAERDADRKRFLSGCSWVLAQSAAGQQPPRWLQVGSSWATQVPGGTSPTGAFVAFSDAATATALVSSGTLTVYAFEGLLRVDERPTVLQ